ncbi:hypothetical protein HELRODRAFT_167298 [Helobdella robusta]|uniref:Uncharacterized protein n=1 Tax=Helobdella robusta TaxID=6412 RepID=T1EZ84_HELRO|nr:hypothetical protein HELRODRAFT_167298 [Helobdella robusta]ESO10799.1 hypothetical protein HELRODRAFT_167298 [Helobdella robusta]
MADIYETENNYTLACSEKRLEPNPTVINMLQFEMDENIILCNKSTSLYLAGNNKVMTDTRLTDTDMDVFERWLTNNTYVIALDLRFNNITDKGALSIAKLLTKNFSIQKLNLMCNDIGPKGAQYIAGSLHRNKAIKSLRMTGNKIGDKGGVYFAEALQINDQLEELDLGDCDLKISSIITAPC